MEELKKQIHKLIENNSTNVEVYSNKIAYPATDTDPEEYASSDVDVYCEVTRKGDIEYTGDHLKTTNLQKFYIVFKDENNFEAEKTSAIENDPDGEKNYDWDKIIAIVSDGDDYCDVINESNLESDCNRISDYILDKLDPSDLEFEEPDPPDPPEPSDWDLRW